MWKEISSLAGLNHYSSKTGVNFQLACGSVCLENPVDEGIPSSEGSWAPRVVFAHCWCLLQWCGSLLCLQTALAIRTSARLLVPVLT